MNKNYSLSCFYGFNIPPEVSYLVRCFLVFSFTLKFYFELLILVGYLCVCVCTECAGVQVPAEARRGFWIPQLSGSQTVGHDPCMCGGAGGGGGEVD